MIVLVTTRKLRAISVSGTSNRQAANPLKSTSSFFGEVPRKGILQISKLNYEKIGALVK
jgi:hypothetical protein